MASGQSPPDPLGCATSLVLSPPGFEIALDVTTPLSAGHLRPWWNLVTRAPSRVCHARETHGGRGVSPTFPRCSISRAPNTAFSVLIMGWFPCAAKSELLCRSTYSLWSSKYLLSGTFRKSLKNPGLKGKGILRRGFYITKFPTSICNREG